MKKLSFALLIIGLLHVVLLGFLYFAHRQFGNVHVGVQILYLLLSWPVIVLLMVFLVLWYLHQPLADLIGRTRRIGKGDWLLEAEQQKQLPQTGKDPRKGEISWEGWVLEVGQKLSPQDMEIIGGAQRQILLAWIKYWWFEKIWGQIYQSQVSLLEHVATKESESLGEVQQFFQEHLTRLGFSYPNVNLILRDANLRNRYFLNYLNFLQSAYLIQIDGDHVEATELAKEFPQYLGMQNYRKELRLW